MKNLYTIILLLTTTFSSCITYETSISGISNASSIKVVKARKSSTDYDKNLILFINKKEYVIGKIFNDKKSIKAPVFPIPSGENKVIIKSDDEIIYQKTLFISNRETRKIILE